MAAPARPLRSIPRNVLLLGLASFFADVSGEMLFAILPFFLTATGATGLAIGLAGGLGDGIAETIKLLGGRASDHAKRRKPFILLGYGLSAIGKLGIAAATAWPIIVAARGFERVGKGLRSAPRDALLAESTDHTRRGATFGLHRAMDTTGALLGVAAALTLTLTLASPPRDIILTAATLGLLALLPLLALRETPTTRAPTKKLRATLTGLPPAFRNLLLATTLFGLANFTHLLFILHAANHLPPQHRIPGALLLYLAFNATYAAAAWPIGTLSDHIGRPQVLLAGFTLFALTTTGFALATTPTALALLFPLLGLAHALIDATARAMTVDTSEGIGKGTALGTYHTTVGIATLTGSAIAGTLWDTIQPQAAFLWGTTLATIAAATLATTTPKPTKTNKPPTPTPPRP